MTDIEPRTPRDILNDLAERARPFMSPEMADFLARELKSIREDAESRVNALGSVDPDVRELSLSIGDAGLERRILFLGQTLEQVWIEASNQSAWDWLSKQASELLGLAAEGLKNPVAQCVAQLLARALISTIEKIKNKA